LVLTIAREVQTLHAGLYLVGGFVRDLLLDVPNLDIDFVVEGDVSALVEHLCRQFGGEMRYHAQFGTAKWLLDEQIARRFNLADLPPAWPMFIDFATARAEFYEQPTALPTVRQSSIKQDLHRRDFTINTMAVRLSPEPMGELLDYYNGRRDLSEGLIRVLHSLSFVDDPTRMIRAVRFEQRLGFRIEPRTETLLRDALPFLDRMTGERIRHELNLILAEQFPLRALKRLDHLRILRRIHPKLCLDEWAEAAVRALLSARDSPPWELSAGFDDWNVALFSLLVIRFSREELERLGRRLRISRRNLEHLLAVQAGFQILYNLKPETPASRVVTLLEPWGEVGWLANWAAAPLADLRRIIVQFVTHWQHIRPTYDGNRLIALGMRPGPAIGRVLRELHRAWLDGDIENTQQEDAYVEMLMRTQEN
jgi:tRNA nucleotidyltransferase (CCA-adding enzyme)